MSTNSTSPPTDNSSSAAAPPTNSTPSPPPPSESTPSPPPQSSESPPTSDNGSSGSNNSSSSLPSNSQPSTPTPVTPKLSSSTPSSKSLTRNSPDKDSSFSSDGSDLNLPIIVGTVAGVAFFIVLMMIVCMCCFQKKKKKKPRNQMHYYSDYQDSDLYSTGLPPKWHNGHQGMDDVVKVQPQGGKHGGGWHMPQQQMMMSSGEMSSGYSGPHGAPLPPPSPALALGFNKSTFSYEELAAATSGFSQANLLGQGGFGYVHKGVLPNGKVVAVKQLKAGSGQGEREFHAEVDIISRVHHRHLVSLVGYCIAGSQRLLVYEFVENRTLEYHLHGKGLPVMDFHTRLKIAIGAAKGLAYLHEDCHPRIIHRDIKSANILLDFKFEAMVADFGLAKLTTDNHTHVSTRVMGTFGYLAPEYASSGKLTEKSDVFSYGVMLLEIITGRRPVDNSSTFMEDSLVDWARPVLMRALGDGNFDEVVDPRLDGNYDPMEIARMAACAAAAVRHSAKRRPKMSQIVRALEGDVSLEDLNEGMRPGQSMLFSSGSDYDSGSYMTSMNRIRKAALASPEYSDDYSGPVADYGHHSGSSSDVGYSEDMNAVGHHGNRRYGL